MLSVGDEYFVDLMISTPFCRHINLKVLIINTFIFDMLLAVGKIEINLKVKASLYKELK